MPVTTIRLNTWAQLSEYHTRGWIYRGMGDASHDLKSSLERRMDQGGVPPTARREFEERGFREFRRGYHQYAARLPDVGWTLEWMSIMQHYGAPTRLLDFTYSIYVAAY